MRNTVLILASLEDIHAQSLATIIRKEYGCRPVIWDCAGFPATDSLGFSMAQDGSRDFSIRAADGTDVVLESLLSVWWRRPGKFKISESVEDPKVRGYCVSECSAFFRGIFDTLGVPVVNHPVAENAAARKPAQLESACAVGLTIPRTLMTNDPHAVTNFWKEQKGDAIYKTFTPPSWQMAETRPLTEEALKGLDQLRHAPIIVQERIEKGVDVRVNVFGADVFAASVQTRMSAAELDWRLDLSATWKDHVLPTEIADKLRQLIKRLDLEYGCIDMRQRPDESYVFLEVNPSGQFLFIEIDTRQPLLRSLAKLLIPGSSQMGGAHSRPALRRK